MKKAKKYVVCFEPSGLKIEIPAGTVLLEAARKAGIYLTSICGGDGYCGKCKVIIDRSEQFQSRPAGRGGAGNTGIDRVRSFEYGIEAALTEAAGFDLLTMGRPEGPGCYCAANNLLREFLRRLSSQYGFVVIDNEAGMEHLSRRTANNIDLLFIVAEATALGAVTAERIFELAEKLPISVKETGVIWNKIDRGNELNGIATFGSVPYDEVLFDSSMNGKTVFEIELSSPAFAAMRKILDDKLKEMTKPR